MDILIFLVSFLIGILPSVFLYKWLIKQDDDKTYKEICKLSLKKGLLAVFPVFLMSAVFYIVGRILFLLIDNQLLYQAYYKFFVLAFVEEFVKFSILKKILKNNSYKYSWFNITVFMIIIGLGFGCSENLMVAIGSNFIIMVIRAISMGHAGYGLIMGWLYGKMIKTNKKIYGVLGFIIPWLLHGLYDFGLTQELIDISDNFAMISVALEFVCILFVFLIIRFVRKRRKSSDFTEVLKIKK